MQPYSRTCPDEQVAYLYSAEDMSSKEANYCQPTFAGLKSSNHRFTTLGGISRESKSRLAVQIHE